MKILRWAVPAVLAGFLAWIISAHLWGLLYGLGVHPYPQSSSTPWTYQLWSGLIPALTVLSLLGALAGVFRHLNCKAPRCARIGHYPDSRGVRWCWRHHPDHKGQKPTLEMLHRLHFEHRDRQR